MLTLLCYCILVNSDWGLLFLFCDINKCMLVRHYILLLYHYMDRKCLGLFSFFYKAIGCCTIPCCYLICTHVDQLCANFASLLQVEELEYFKIIIAEEWNDTVMIIEELLYCFLFIILVALLLVLVYDIFCCAAGIFGKWVRSGFLFVVRLLDTPVVRLRSSGVSYGQTVTELVYL